MRQRYLVAIVVITTALAITNLPAAASKDARARSAFEALSRGPASRFNAPADMKLIRMIKLPGATYERYQQVYGSAHAIVFGGQISIYRNASGTARTVIGSHYPGIELTNSVKLSKAAAYQRVAADIGTHGRRTGRLMIDPESGRYFYSVETQRFAQRWIHWIDAENGRILTKVNAIQNDHGLGVKGDVKDLDGQAGLADDLTVFSQGVWNLVSRDGRQFTSDGRDTGSTSKPPATDADNHWDLITPDRSSPGQPALVDAQYYANVTDDFYRNALNFDFTDCFPDGMQLIAHYGKDYDNAFWNGKVTVFGNGSGV